MSNPPSLSMLPPDAEVHFLNVGQGDATLAIDHTERAAALVDCHRSGEDAVEGLIKTAHADLRATFVSHFHADHFDSIPNIVKRHAETSIYCNASVKHLSNRDQRAQVRAFKRWLADEKRSGRQRDEVRQGDTGSVGAISWTCLAPDVGLLDSAEADASENRASIVLLFTLPGLTILLGADADAIVWEHIKSHYTDSVDILRVPHHGGQVVPDGHLEPVDIVNQYSPQFSVVSVGTVNRYAHPDPSWPAAAAQTGRVLCTQVTKMCQGSSLNGPMPCAGSITVQWWRSGEWRVLPEASAHLAVVRGWDHAVCL